MRFVCQIPAMLGGRIGRLSSLCEEEALLRQIASRSVFGHETFLGSLPDGRQNLAQIIR